MISQCLCSRHRADRGGPDGGGAGVFDYYKLDITNYENVVGALTGPPTMFP